LVKTEALKSSLNTIDVNGLAEGMYIIEINTGSESVIQKLIIKH
jgi:hypothetical protein